MELETKEIEDEVELEDYIGQKLIQNKEKIVMDLELIRLTSVCEEVCLLGQYMQEQRRLSDEKRVKVLDLAVNMFL